MFTLHFPIKLPEEHTFFDNGQYPVPPLPGGLSLRCFSNDKMPVVLQISGFASEQSAINYCATLTSALRLAALDCRHSITPSSAAAVASGARHFDGSVPTVTVTDKGAMPYHATMSMQNGVHISVLSNLIGASLAQGLPAKVNTSPELALSLELYSNYQFSGERNARFVMLLTALEVLVPNTSSKGKRGAVIALVKAQLSKVKHPDPKSVSKVLDSLYTARNAPFIKPSQFQMLSWMR